MMRVLHAVYKRANKVFEKITHTSPNSKFSKPVLVENKANELIKNLITSWQAVYAYKVWSSRAGLCYEL
jgi:hypothetical protein